MESGVVHDVKKPGAELNVKAIRDSFHAEVFEYREIDVDQAGTDHAGATVVTEQIHARSRDFVATAIDSQHTHSGERSGGHRRSEAAQLKVVVDVAGIDGVTASWPGDASGIKPRLTAALTVPSAGHHERTRVADI